MADDTPIMVVWEASSLIPVLFTDPEEAYAYRTKRINTGRLHHQVYVQPAVIDAYAAPKKG